MRPFIASLLLAAAAQSLAAAAPTETEWLRVTLDGRKIGHVQSQRERDGDRVTTTDRMRLEIDRGGIVLALTTEERSVETVAGKPIAFSARIALTGVETVIEGTLRADGKADVVTRSSGREDRKTIDWPAGAVLAHGAHLAELAQPLVPGTKYQLLAFQPSDLIALPVSVTVVGPARVQVGTRQEDLVEVEQSVQLAGSPLRTRSWVTAKHELRKTTIPLFGLELVMLACPEACAKAPNQSADVLERTVARAPGALDREGLVRGMRYDIAIAGTDPARLPDTGEQRVSARANGWVVEVDPSPDRPDTTKPRPSELAPSRWLESDDPQLVALARKAADGAVDDAGRMLKLEAFVRGYIDSKSLRVGYASALETVKSRAGDCTEHALLLAALGRAIGIPTRVVNGLAYAPSFAGYDHVFVPHAWVQAWTGSAWRSYDAALAGFDGGHIAFSVGDGEASSFYAGVSLLGNLEIVAANASDADAR